MGEDRSLFLGGFASICEYLMCGQGVFFHDPDVEGMEVLS